MLQHDFGFGFGACNHTHNSYQSLNLANQERDVSLFCTGNEAPRLEQG